MKLDLKLLANSSDRGQIANAPIIVLFVFPAIFTAFLLILWWVAFRSSSWKIKLSALVLLLVIASLPITYDLLVNQYYNVLKISYGQKAEETDIVNYQERPYSLPGSVSPIGLEVNFNLTEASKNIYVVKSRLHIYMTEPTGQIFKISCLPLTKEAVLDHRLGQRVHTKLLVTRMNPLFLSTTFQEVYDDSSADIMINDNAGPQTSAHALCLPEAVESLDKNTHEVCLNDTESGAVAPTTLYDPDTILKKLGNISQGDAMSAASAEGNAFVLSSQYLHGNEVERAKSACYTSFLEEHKQKEGKVQIVFYTLFAPYGHAPSITAKLKGHLPPQSKLIDYAFWHDVIKNVQSKAIINAGYSNCKGEKGNCFAPKGPSCIPDILKPF